MTIREAVKRSGTPVALSGASIDAAEKLLQKGEKVCHAIVSNCTSPATGRASGTLVVTTHRILFCTSTLGKVQSDASLFCDCVGVGDISGGLIRKMDITSEGKTITVEMSDKKQMATLQAAILDAISMYPNQVTIDFAVSEPELVHSTGTDSMPAKDATIKICKACGDRLLAGARKCPSCGSKDLEEVDRNDSERIEALRSYARSKKSATPVAPQKVSTKQRIKENKAAGIACCPKCGSTSLSANKKGFSLGKAAVGAFVAGPIGLVGGTMGANKVEVTCLNCGYKFKPGK